MIKKSNKNQTKIKQKSNKNQTKKYVGGAFKMAPSISSIKMTSTGSAAPIKTNYPKGSAAAAAAAPKTPMFAGVKKALPKLTAGLSVATQVAKNSAEAFAAFLITGRTQKRRVSDLASNTNYADMAKDMFNPNPSKGKNHSNFHQKYYARTNVSDLNKASSRLTELNREKTKAEQNIRKLEIYRNRSESTDPKVQKKAKSNASILENYLKSKETYAQAFRRKLQDARTGKKTVFITPETIEAKLTEKKNILARVANAEATYLKDLRAKKPILSQTNISVGSSPSTPVNSPPPLVPRATKTATVTMDAATVEKERRRIQNEKDGYMDIA
jgi:hypothetical protein